MIFWSCFQGSSIEGSSFFNEVSSLWGDIKRKRFSGNPNTIQLALLPLGVCVCLGGGELESNPPNYYS